MYRWSVFRVICKLTWEYVFTFIEGHCLRRWRVIIQNHVLEHRVQAVPLCSITAVP